MSFNATSITKSFAGIPVLTDVSIELSKGSIHALVGENGAGKSTLLQIMAGIYRADGGAVTLDGMLTYDNPAVKERIAFIPTQCMLLPGYNERELLRIYTDIYQKFDIHKYRDIAGEMHIGRKSIHHLSTGMQMVVSIALAMATMPDVLLLDEPFAGLDVIMRHRIITALIEERSRRDISVLVSSHNVNELEKLCDSATFISHGKIIKSGDLENVKSDSVRRFQVVFGGEAPDSLDEWPGIMSLERVGRVYYLAVDGGALDIQDKLHASGAVVIDELAISLEEAFRFIYEWEEKRNG